MKIDKRQKVSIGIPTYNRCNLLGDAINSALKQTYKNIEIIVFDNDSTDDTDQIIFSFEDSRLFYFRNDKNIGMVGNWNSCLEKATGEFFLLLSDDDILEEYAIEILIAGFIDDTISLSYGGVSFIDENNFPLELNNLSAPEIESGRNLVLNILKYKRAVYPSASLIRTSTAKKMGGYPNIGSATDFALIGTLVKDSNVYYTNKKIVKYRIHKKSESFSNKALQSQLELVEWATREGCPLKEFKNQLYGYCKNAVFKLGRYHALRGHKSELNTALHILKKISNNFYLRYLLMLYNLNIIRKLNYLRKYFCLSEK